MTTTPLPPSRVPDESPTGDVVVHVFGRTDVGKTREHNEDAFIVADLSANNATLQPEVRTHLSGRRGSLFMVADGMGGAAAGEIASAMAVDVVLRDLTARWLGAERRDAEAFATALKLAAATANAQINAFATEHPEYHGMGTTATIAGLLDDTLYLAQVGDSRAYLVRDGMAWQITKDQSLLQKLIEAGELTEEEAAQSERRNIILQALGPEPVIRVDLTHQQVRRGDTLVLCSDGLSGQVRGEEIAQVVHEEPDLVSACRRLIEMANERGGPDNITVIVARFEGTGLQVASQQDEVGHRVFRLADSEPTATTPVVPMSSVDTLETPARRSSGASVRNGRPTPVGTPAPAALDPRRSRGAVIAGVLLLTLLAGGAWFVWRAAHKLTTRTSAPASTATDSTAAKAR